MNEPKVELCDKNCNECPIIRHPNSRMLTRVLNELDEKYGDYGDGVLPVVNNLCPNMTVCYDCRIDDFCHTEKDCKIIGE